MGHKRITEKDFWICSEGNVPAQLQSTQKSTKKSSGEKYITVKDTSTSSWIDFGCKKAMLIYAIIAAAVVVIAAMTVATGGAALIALGALAGLAGAAWGAVIGALLCGQTAAKGRTWIEVPKARMTSIQGVRQITGDCTMTCMVGGTISFAPEIKSWSQAVSLGAANYIGGLMEGMMAGAAIGMGGAAISGGAGAFGAGGMRGLGQAALQFAKSAPMNVLRNIGASFGYAGVGASTSAVTTTIGAAVGLRGLTSAQAGLQHYGSTGESGWGAAGKGVVGMETGMYHSVKNLTTFHNPETGAFEWQGTWQDVTGLALLLSPVHKAAEEVNGKKPKGEEPVQDGEGIRDPNINNERRTGQEGESGTFEDAVADPPGTYRDNKGRLRDTQTKQFVADPNRIAEQRAAPDPNNPNNPNRPSWRQSELDAEQAYPNYDTQKSFIDRKEVPYGTEGSTRPDLYAEGHSVEVKNYDVETSSGRGNLNRELTRQYNERIEHLPEGTSQTAVIDVRGQNISPEALIQLEADIVQNCPDLEVIFVQ
ncbi:hypothetical protein [Pedobacter cryoconitis]|uniref:hypothetical protein n=1 Tax=Pedobacter cryoconitis TaxID=188932 RepID=UPI00161CB45F|nr:hypothetical protein [Pedobacter cryoconitis]MBB5645294.1 hypothetical protein [Pedobacter cryoconitis]